MECKFIYVSDTSLADGELIDTLWNVNPFTNGVFKGGLFELIDTLWNVNVGTVVYGGYPVKRINRYIIE